ncbi:MAG: SIS domain-containing protein [Ignavibacteria bacterium]|nr:SIS domain-containing protein [Ignavibacteria bacterium]
MNDSLKESSEIKLLVLEKCTEDILKVTDLLIERVKSGNKIMLCGNGGSAADAQHIATEFMVRLSHDIKRPAIPALALNTDTSNLTAGGNDIGFVNIFARSVEGLGKKGDVLVCISTSGNSVNIINAVHKAKEIGIISVGLLGMGGGKLAKLCDNNIIVPSDNIQRIQESHITIGHILCELTERNI